MTRFANSWRFWAAKSIGSAAARANGRRRLAGLAIFTAVIFFYSIRGLYFMWGGLGCWGFPPRKNEAISWQCGRIWRFGRTNPRWGRKRAFCFLQNEANFPGRSVVRRWSSCLALEEPRTTDTLRSAAHGCFSHFPAALLRAVRCKNEAICGGVGGLAILRNEPGDWRKWDFCRTNPISGRSVVSSMVIVFTCCLAFSFFGHTSRRLCVASSRLWFPGVSRPEGFFFRERASAPRIEWSTLR